MYCTQQVRQLFRLQNPGLELALRGFEGPLGYYLVRHGICYDSLTRDAGRPGQIADLMTRDPAVSGVQLQTSPCT